MKVIYLSFLFTGVPIFTVESSKEPHGLAFLHNIRSELVSDNPDENIRGFIKALHPRYVTFENKRLLYDPIGKDIVGAFSPAGNCPYIFDRGYMRKNPEDPADHEFEWRPDVLPFKKPKGKFHVFFKKAQKFDKNFTIDLMLRSKCQIND